MLMMKINIFAITLVWLLLGFVSTHAQSQPCGCADKQDLLNHLRTSRIAIQESQFQIDTFIAREVADGSPYLYSQERLLRLLESIKNAQRSVRVKGGATSSLTMNPYDCSITETTPSSGCLRQISQHYLDHLRRVCLSNKSSRKPDEPYFERMEMKQIALQLMMAENESEKFILQMLTSLPANCRSNGWFGYVVHQKVSTSETTGRIATRGTEYPRPSAGITKSNGGTDTTATKTTYIGTIYVEDGKMSSAKGYAASSLDAGTIETGRVFCSAKKPDVPFVVTTSIKNFLEGESGGSGVFTLSIQANGNYSIGVSFFNVPVTGTMTSSRNVNACDAKPTNYSNHITDKKNTASYRFDGKMKPGFPDLIEGSIVEKPPLLQIHQQGESTVVDQTYELQTRWMLRRIR